MISCRLQLSKDRSHMTNMKIKGFRSEFHIPLAMTTSFLTGFLHPYLPDFL